MLHLCYQHFQLNIQHHLLPTRYTLALNSILVGILALTPNLKSEYGLLALCDAAFDQGKGMEMFDNHSVLRLRVNGTFFTDPHSI